MAFQPINTFHKAFPSFGSGLKVCLNALGHSLLAALWGPCGLICLILMNINQVFVEFVLFCWVCLKMFNPALSSDAGPSGILQTRKQLFMKGLQSLWEGLKAILVLGVYAVLPIILIPVSVGRVGRDFIMGSGAKGSSIWTEGSLIWEKTLGQRCLQLPGLLEFICIDIYRIMIQCDKWVEFYRKAMSAKHADAPLNSEDMGSSGSENTIKSVCERLKHLLFRTSGASSTENGSSPVKHDVKNNRKSPPSP